MRAAIVGVVVGALLGLGIAFGVTAGTDRSENSTFQISLIVLGGGGAILGGVIGGAISALLGGKEKLRRQAAGEEPIPQSRPGGAIVGTFVVIASIAFSAYKGCRAGEAMRNTQRQSDATHIGQLAPPE